MKIDCPDGESMKRYSEQQHKAIMASLRNRGLIYPELEGNYYSGSDYNFDWKLDPQDVKKTRKMELQQVIRENELNAERKQRPVIEEEIKQILDVEVSVDYGERVLLSDRFNDVIRKAVQNGIDRNIIKKLREIQQQLVNGIPSMTIIVKMQETQQQVKTQETQQQVRNQETQQQLVKGMPQKRVKNIPKHVKCIYCENLIKTQSRHCNYYIFHGMYFICGKCTQKIRQP